MKFLKLLVFSCCLSLQCAKVGLLDTSIAKPHFPPQALHLPEKGLPDSNELKNDMATLQRLKSNLQTRSTPLSLNDFQQVIVTLQSVEQKLGLLGMAYHSLQEQGEFLLEPGEWVRIALQSYCLNAGRASPDSNEVYSVDKLSSQYRDWLPQLMAYSQTHKIEQSKIQHLVWRLSSGAEYKDLSEEDKAVVREAIPELSKPFGDFIAFWKRWGASWKELFEDIGRVEADLEQRKSKIPLAEPPTRWLKLKTGLAIRVDHVDSYRKVYLTVVNLNPPHSEETKPQSLSSLFIASASAQDAEETGKSVIFNPTDYILKAGRDDVQPLALSPQWGDVLLGEAGGLLASLYDLIRELGVSFVPIVNDLVDLYEFLWGKDYLSESELTLWERSFSAMGLVIGSGHGYRKGIDELGKLIQEGKRSGILGGGAAEGAEQALEQAGRVIKRLERFADPRFALQLEKQFAKHGPKSIKKSLRSLEKRLTEHRAKLPRLEHKQHVAHEIKVFERQIETLQTFMRERSIP